MITMRDVGQSRMHDPVFHRHLRRLHHPAWAQVPQGHHHGCSPFLYLTPNVCLNLSSHDRGPERCQSSPHKPLHRALWRQRVTRSSLNPIGKKIRAATHQDPRLPISNGNAGGRTMILVGRRNGLGWGLDRTRLGQAQIPRIPAM